MAYSLGIDVGTTYTAGAIRKFDERGTGKAEALRLGNRSTVAPSVVFIGENGQWLFGDAAERRGPERPDHVAREFKRRIGDPIPLVVGPACPLPEELVARIVSWVIGRASDQEGAAPASITVTHPAGWSSYKCRLLRSALDDAGVVGAVLISEPVAAAAHYSALERIAAGTSVAVYDLGGGTFDTAVVRTRDDGGFDLLGSPSGLDHVGGADFDEAVLRHVKQSIDLPAVDPADQDAMAAMLRLRRECTEAKEALSIDTEATVSVLWPQHQRRVRLVRRELEELIRADVIETVDVLADTIAAAGLAVDDVDAVLLVGGSSRMPLVAELVSNRLGRPVVVDADPETAIALGAAVAAANVGSLATAGPVSVAPVAPVADTAGPAAAGHGATDPGRRARPSRRRRAVALSAAGVVVLAGTGVAAIGAFGSGEAPRIVADAVAGPERAEAAPVQETSAQDAPAASPDAAAIRQPPGAPTGGQADAAALSGSPATGSLDSAANGSAITPSQRASGTAGTSAAMSFIASAVPLAAAVLSPVTAELAEAAMPAAATTPAAGAPATAPAAEPGENTVPGTPAPVPTPGTTTTSPPATNPGGGTGEPPPPPVTTAPPTTDSNPTGPGDPPATTDPPAITTTTDAPPTTEAPPPDTDPPAPTTTAPSNDDQTTRLEETTTTTSTSTTTTTIGLLRDDGTEAGPTGDLNRVEETAPPSSGPG